MINITWDTVMRDVYMMTESVTDYFDAVVGIANGGIVPAVLIANRLGVKDILTIYKSYDRDYVESMLQDYEKVLIIDDINDTGDTISQYLNLDHNNCRCATLYRRYNTKQSKVAYGRQLESNEYFQFPWEYYS